MSTTQIIHWVLWGLSLFAGIGVILALFKLRIAEKSLPPWKELNPHFPDELHKPEAVRYSSAA